MKKHFTFLLFIFFLVISSFAQETNVKKIIVVEKLTYNQAGSGDDWFPTKLSRDIMTVINKYAPKEAYSVHSRLDEDKIIEELAYQETSGLYNTKVSTEDFTNPNIQIIGEILNINNVYNVTIRALDISAGNTGIVIGEASGSFPAQNFETAYPGNVLSCDLMESMGIKLANEIKTQLKTVTSEIQSANIAYAKGLLSAETKRYEEALDFLMKAKLEDPSLKEAKSLAGIISGQISSENFSDSIEDKFEYKERFEELIEQSAKYIVENPPYEIYISENLDFSLNKKNNSVVFKVPRIIFTASGSNLDIIRNIHKMIKSEPETEKWKTISKVPYFPCSYTKDNSWIPDSFDYLNVTKKGKYSGKKASDMYMDHICLNNCSACYDPDNFMTLLEVNLTLVDEDDNPLSDTYGFLMANFTPKYSGGKLRFYIAAHNMFQSKTKGLEIDTLRVVKGNILQLKPNGKSIQSFEVPLDNLEGKEPHWKVETYLSNARGNLFSGLFGKAADIKKIKKLDTEVYFVDDETLDKLN